MLNVKLFDVHTHTHFAAFAEDKDAVIWRALDAGVWMINVGEREITIKKAGTCCPRPLSLGFNSLIRINPKLS